MGRIEDKIREIRKYLNELSSIAPKDFNEYRKNLEKKAACERYFEKVTEAAIDLAFLVIKEHGLRIPKEEKDAFDILADENIITKDLAKRLRNAKGMRNIISHQYGNIDDEIVFESIAEELEKDVKEFIIALRRPN